MPFLHYSLLVTMGTWRGMKLPVHYANPTPSSMGKQGYPKPNWRWILGKETLDGH